LGEFLKGFLVRNGARGNFRTRTSTNRNNRGHRFDNRIEKIAIARGKHIANLVILPNKGLANILGKLLELGSIILHLVLSEDSFIDRGVYKLLKTEVLLRFNKLESLGDNITVLLLKIVNRKRNRAVFARAIDKFANDCILDEILKRSDRTVVLVEKSFLAAAGTTFGGDEIDEEILHKVLEVAAELLVVMVRMFENKLASEIVKAKFERIESGKIGNLRGSDALNINIAVSKAGMKFKKLSLGKNSVKEYPTFR
jgi:hypothetical protein